MMYSSAIATGSVFLASIVSLSEGVPLENRQSGFTFECEGINAPDWSDAIADGFTGDPAGLVTVPAGGTGNQVIFNNGDGVNCVVGVQINEAGFAVTYQQVTQGLWGLKDSCRPLKLGGTSVSTNGKWSVFALSNPDYRGTTVVGRRAIPDLGSLDGSVLVPQVKSLAARADGDQSFNVGIHSTGVLGDKQYIGYGIPGEGSYTTTKSDTKSFTYSTSISVSADILKIVSVTVGFEFSTTKSTTTTEGITIPFKCAANENAYLFLQPLLEVWSGALSPSGEQLSVTRPQTKDDGSALASYDYQCRD